MARACACDVPDVASYHHEVSFQRCGRDQRIDGRDRIERADASPAFCNRMIDVDDAVHELTLNAMQPGFDCGRGVRVAPSNSFTPRRSSPSVSTLRNSSSDLRLRNQFTTCGLARSRFRISDSTLVSTSVTTISPLVIG